MSYTIDLSDNAKYLVVKVTDEFTIDDVKQWSLDVAQRGQESNVNRFLFDVRHARNASTIMETYNYAFKDFGDLHLPKDVRSAILINKADRSHDFAETALKNRGLNVKIFTDESTAAKWLQEGGS